MERLCIEILALRFSELQVFSIDSLAIALAETLCYDALMPFNKRHKIWLQMRESRWNFRRLWTGLDSGMYYLTRPCGGGMFTTQYITGGELPRDTPRYPSWRDMIHDRRAVISDCCTCLAQEAETIYASRVYGSKCRRLNLDASFKLYRRF